MLKILRKIKSVFLTGAGPVWKLYLTLRGCEIGNNLVAMGRPGLNKKRGSTIQLGNHVILCSSEMANPVARGGRCRLVTLSKEAKIILHDRVGLSSTLLCSASLIEIGEGTIVGGGSMIFDTDFHPRTAEGVWYTDELAVSKPVKIGKRCFIGANSIILKGVSIGDNAVIGAGSVVTRDVPPAAIACGNPAKVVRITEEFKNK